MSHRTLPACLVAILCSVCGPLASAQTCLNYVPDPRLEAEACDSALIYADMLVVQASSLEPATGDVYHMTVTPWVTLDSVPACGDRDYAGQPRVTGVGGPGGGSGVLVGEDLLLTVHHIILNADTCRSDWKFVFGYGNFSPNQWPTTCDANKCWVTIPAGDVYDCADAVTGSGDGLPLDDWAVVRLDRSVAGGIPLPIRRTETPPAWDTLTTIVGHPHHIPLKWQAHSRFRLIDGYHKVFGAHVLPQSSGSMAVDEGTGEVIGIVSFGHYDIVAGCDIAPTCYREDLDDSFGDAEHAVLAPAYLAKDYIP